MHLDIPLSNITGGSAMKLYIKQKVFTWGDKFTVKDINGNDRYYKS